MKRLLRFLVVPFLLGVAFICATPQSYRDGNIRTIIFKLS